MNPSSSGPRLGRSVLAVFAGLLVNVIPAVAIDGVLHATGVFPAMPERMSDGLFILAAAYRVLLGVAGAYVTARLAPRSPVMHALVLGSVGVAMCTAGMLAMRDAGPVWYPLSLIVLIVPCSLLGAALAGKGPTAPTVVSTSAD